ncbi:MAG: hypothetical protein KIH04_08360 [Candidatus Freyarchaeota archaeon]|nr:hypothetical protein [Candidatus Jordarchaeia archaeon]
MTILGTSVAVERAKSRRPINEDMTAVTLVEFPRIVYYKLFLVAELYFLSEMTLLAHRLQLGLLRLEAAGSLAGRLNSYKQRRRINYERKN